MINQAFNFTTIVLLLCFGIGCEKEQVTTTQSTIDDIIVLPEQDVKWALGAVAGEGVVLLVYVDQKNAYNFKLVDNQGSEIWTKTFGYFYVPNADGFVPKMKVIHDLNSSFAIFYDNGLLKIDYDGDVLVQNDNFLSLLVNRTSGLLIHDIKLIDNSHYLICGVTENKSSMVFQVNFDGTTRGIRLTTFTAGYETVYSNVYSLDGDNHFTVQIKLGIDAGSQSNFRIWNFKPFGVSLPFTKTVDLPKGNYAGRGIFKISENKYAFVISPADNQALEKRSMVYYFNDSAVTGITYIDVTSLNIIAGGPPYVSDGLIRNTTGGFIGLMRTRNEIPTDFNTTKPGTNVTPHGGSMYELNEQAELIASRKINTSYSNFFNGIVKMSNNQILLFGTTVSLDEDLKLTLMIH